MEINLKEVGKRIKLIREKHGYTMADLGKLVDTNSASTINNWEKGNNLPNKKRLEKIALLGNTTENWIKYGEFSDYVSKICNEYESNILSRYGEDTLKNFKEALLDTLEMNKISYEDDMKIIKTAKELYDLVLLSKKDNYYAPIHFEVDEEYILEKFENLTRKDFQTMCEALLEKNNLIYDKKNRSQQKLIYLISSMLFDGYKVKQNDFSFLKETYKQE